MEQHHDLQDGLVGAWQHGHDPFGNRTVTLRPDGRPFNRLTCGTERAHGIVLEGKEYAPFARDDLHREIERPLKNGLTCTQTKMSGKQGKMW